MQGALRDHRETEERQRAAGNAGKREAGVARRVWRVLDHDFPCQHDESSEDTAHEENGESDPHLAVKGGTDEQ